MSAQALLIEVRWPDGRFHGVRESRPGQAARGPVAPEWPPSPFRLFQALVAGAYGGRWAGEDAADKDAAFTWLEGLAPPTVSAPAPKTLSPVTYYVPNNDLDAVGGDPDRVNEIRSAKTLRTSLFDADRPAAYLWTFDAGQTAQAERLAELAGRLHTLGHGIDAAFAHAEVLDAAEGEARLAALGGAPRRPSLGARGGPSGGPNSGETGVPCPARGSLDSLRARHEGFTQRFRKGSGKRPPTEFRQPPKPLARAVAYDRSPTRLLYELRPAAGGAAVFAPWPLTEAVALALAVRDQLAEALKAAYPAEVDRYVTGCTAGSADVGRRLRVLPLPSLGGPHTDPGIRRVVVEVPPDHPIPVADLDWCLAGRALSSPDRVARVLVRSMERAMLGRYGVGGDAPPASVWRTVTPAALPWRSGGKQTGEERATAEAEAAGAVTQALRHIGVTTPVVRVRVQREPFGPREARADAFDLTPLGDRFDRRSLRHVEVGFAAPVRGPLALGNGRWLGLGVMHPVDERRTRRAAGSEGLHVFTLSAGPGVDVADTEALTRALRRAVMARAAAARHLRRSEDLPLFFTGHAQSPEPGRRTAPAGGGGHEHLFFALDPGGVGSSAGEHRPGRLLVIAPHLADRSKTVRARIIGRSAEDDWLGWLANTVEGLDDLRAGRFGRFALSPTPVKPDDPVLGRGDVWNSLTPYQPTRHPARGQTPEEAVVADLQHEAERRGLPRPRLDQLIVDTGPRGGLSARVRLTFAVAVPGPILLGRGSHFGAGLFAREAG